MVIYEAAGDVTGEERAVIGVGLTDEDLARLVKGEPLGISAARMQRLAQADLVVVHRGQDGAAIAKALAYTEGRRAQEGLLLKHRPVVLLEDDGLES